MGGATQLADLRPRRSVRLFLCGDVRLRGLRTMSALLSKPMAQFRDTPNPTFGAQRWILPTRRGYGYLSFLSAL